MNVDYTKKFIKQYHKLPKKTQKRFKDRLNTFLVNPNDPLLNNHALKGKYQGYWSINVTGDIRALYIKQGNTMVLFGYIGSHSKLYG